MRYLIKGLCIVSLISLSMLSCTNANKPNSTKRMDYQSIKLDDKHNHASVTEGEQKLTFTIHPDSVLIIDATGYDFKIPDQIKNKKIELVQVIIDKNIYQVNWSDDNKTFIRKSNLELIKGDKEFSGFEENKTVIIGIGVKQDPTEKGAIALGIVYAAMIEIKK